MGERQSIMRAIEKDLRDLFPEESRTAAEASLVKDLCSIIKRDRMFAAELRVLERFVAHVKAVINERAPNDGGRG
jgi:uncharacterized protein with von Willebrand factor type A (vWA) domain